MATPQTGMRDLGETVGTDAVDCVADGVDEMVSAQPWIKTVTRVGWAAKGAVYLLMGFTAITIARHRPTEDDASPEGAVAQVIDNPGGRVLLGVLAVGLVMYGAWRFLSAALIRGGELRDWLERVAYVFSGAFYLMLAWVATTSSLRDRPADDSNTVERLSRNLMSHGWGRWMLGLLGLVILAVGLYFIVEKSLRRSFLDELSLTGASHREREAVTAAGVVGWFGRGVVTVLVGFFVTKAALEVDPDDARGFDRALREAATSSFGALCVAAAGVGLVVYGVFCFISIRHQQLKDHK